MTRTKSKYDDEYIEADKCVVVNDDVDLHKMVLSLPKPPPLHLIDGYGLPPKEQRFSRIPIPHRLIALEKEALEKTSKLVDETAKAGSAITLLKIQKVFWELLKSRRKELRKEIDFIRKAWWFRIHGMWFFCNGKPTWISGRHFYYLNFFHLDTKSGYPDYRDCDRREYVFMEYCWTATETFERTDKDGNAIKDKNGKYNMIDLGRRVCLGSAQSKNRRRGNTSKAISDGLEVVTRTSGSDGFGIQSYSEENAKAHFKGKVMPAWDGLPIWLKPFSTSGRVADTLKLDVAKNDFGIKGLQTQVVYATTASPKAFDGKKKICLLTDEEGKELVGGSVSKRWEVNKHTLAQGDGMVVSGFSYHPSTSDQQAAGSFDYYYLIKSSNFFRRIPVKGQTISGLYRIFIPAQDGLEGYIDSYGYSVTGEIAEYQKKEGFTVTAEEYLKGERDLLLQDGSPEAMMKLREHKKLFPMQFSDSWLGTAGNIGFNLEYIDKRLAVLRREDSTVRGDLVWVDGEFGGDVEFEANEESGRFQIAEFPKQGVSNKKTQALMYNTFEGEDVMQWRPIHHDVYVAGADPYRFSNKQDAKVGASKGAKSRLSDGGIAVVQKYDESIDGGKPMSEWSTYKSVLSYRYRPANTDEYGEDLLKVCIFYGAMAYIETNVPTAYEYFIKNNYGGYLLHDIDLKTGRYKEKAGMDSLERSKQSLFSKLRDYIEYRCHVEPFSDFLQECKDINGIEEMRHFDRLTAHGLALMGCETPYAKEKYGEEESGLDAGDYWDFTT